MTVLDRPVSRRTVVGGGALIVSFTLFPHRVLAQEPDAQAADQSVDQEAAPKLPGSLEDNPMLESWIRIDADGSITVFTGKVELGQGIKTALIQVAAEELMVDAAAIRLLTADTALTPDERYTAGSQSMQDSATAILHASAQVRALLVAAAAERLGVAADRLTVDNGAIAAPDGRRLAYGELVGDRIRNVRAEPTSNLKDPTTYSIIGRDMARVDIPAKVTGGAAYVHDFRPDGMVHARVVRPPSYGARLRSVDTARAEAMPGVLQVVRNGSYLAVVAGSEWQAVKAMRELATSADWEEQPMLPDRSKLFEVIQNLPARRRPIHRASAPAAPVAHRHAASYRRAYQMHAAIGPSCAVGLYENASLTIWTHSQGVYPLQRAIAEMMRMPEDRVRCIHLEGSGCYGHNGADDAGADAALIARAVPGRPVRVQWMREDEHCWEPYGPAMVSEARAGLDAEGNIVAFGYEVWSNAHSSRPGPAGTLSPAWLIDDPFRLPAPNPIPQPAGGGDRNAIPLYAIPNVDVVDHFIPRMPLRVSALRALGGYMNVFAIESFMDELAAIAGADPVEFRLRHLNDERARDAVAMAAERFGWGSGEALPRGRGRGFGFARYKNLAAYCAVAAEVEVERETGRVRLVRAVSAIDSGQAVNPDGIRNQTEGGIIQSASWTLHEQVTFDETRITSRDWTTYPILRMSEVPDSIEVHVIDRPGAPYLGTGEAAQGPAAAAIANALADATGVRLRELPLTMERVKAAIGV